MAKRTKLKIDTRGPLQRVIDGERGSIIDRDGVAEYQDNAPLVNDFTARHGQYERNLTKVVNRGGTPVARWQSAGLLSDSQNAAIDHCIRLWDAIGTSGGLVANLDRTVFGSPGEGNIREIEARDDLHRIKGYFPTKYWDTYENVVRFDEPAGFAGSRLTECKNDAVAAARTVVQFVADIISMKERLSY